MNVETSVPGPPRSKPRPRSRGVLAIGTALSILTLVADGVSAGPESRVPWTAWHHTRPLSPGAIRLIEDASERSQIVTGLMKALEKTDLLVYISDSMPPGVTTGPASYLTFLSSDQKGRYLMVRIDSFRLSPSERIVALGHELQHALEVAAAPEVKDAASLAKLYRRIGRESPGGRFESEAAHDMGNRVRASLDRVGQ